MNKTRLILAIAASLVACSCTQVKPWERGHLAGYHMRSNRDPLTDSVSDHVWFTREAFTGGRGVGGGGCGCN